ncbi:MULTISPECIES: DUF6875 domain-containing protein [unclassified Rhodococcus (in: high G+C Gram-positive bacteria)]|uniref:DUF6875 domain-containing protein n=1 Tax=Rhodococcus sp. SJ-3 TaxID=3454628 RepID=UPI002DA70FEB|nr:hypothetical protein [Rhodococcus sp. (in: high G+C Gram-positive bacteria)]
MTDQTRVLRGRRSGIEPVSVFDDVRDDEHPRTGELRRWAVDFLCSPHDDLGRSGPVCPFAAPSIGRGLFYAVFVPGAVDAQRMRDVADDLAELFPHFSPVSGPDAALRSVVAVFPDVTDYEVIELVQNERKSDFVLAGLMLGQFYPGCTVSGLRNSAFRALDAPLPMLAVRHMVGSDFPFLASQREWILAYLKKFAASVPSMVRSDIADRVVT